MLRLQLLMEYKHRDWRKLPFDDVRRFLRHLFGDNGKKTGNGIFVRRDGKKWTLTFKGLVTFNHQIVNGRPAARWQKAMNEALNMEIMSEYRNALENASIRPDMDNSSARWAGGLRAPR